MNNYVNLCDLVNLFIYFTKGSIAKSPKSDTQFLKKKNASITLKGIKGNFCQATFGHSEWVKLFFF